MNRFLLYINDVLESLDIPTTNNLTQKRYKSSAKKHSKNIEIEEK